MEDFKKLELFNAEIALINNKDIRNKVVNMLLKLPEYFYTTPASSSGKYHPKYALGVGGLVRHTKAAVLIANSLSELEMYKDLNKDYVIAALILHDGLKLGLRGSNYTVVEHPTLMADYIQANHPDDADMTVIAELVATHMGQWNRDYKTNEEVLPKPNTSIQNFVHLCDYLASRKFLEVVF